MDFAPIEERCGHPINKGVLMANSKETQSPDGLATLDRIHRKLTLVIWGSGIMVAFNCCILFLLMTR